MASNTLGGPHSRSATTHAMLTQVPEEVPSIRSSQPSRTLNGEPVRKSRETHSLSQGPPRLINEPQQIPTQIQRPNLSNGDSSLNARVSNQKQNKQQQDNRQSQNVPLQTMADPSNQVPPQLPKFYPPGETVIRTQPIPSTLINSNIPPPNSYVVGLQLQMNPAQDKQNKQQHAQKVKLQMGLQKIRQPLPPRARPVESSSPSPSPDPANRQQVISEVPQRTAAGLPQTQIQVKRFSRETTYESDQSVNEIESNFPQQPSSGETMEYKYKKTQSNTQAPTTDTQPAPSATLPQPQQQQRNKKDKRPFNAPRRTEQLPPRSTGEDKIQDAADTLLPYPAETIIASVHTSQVDKQLYDPPLIERESERNGRLSPEPIRVVQKDVHNYSQNTLSYSKDDNIPLRISKEELKENQQEEVFAQEEYKSGQSPQFASSRASNVNLQFQQIQHEYDLDQEAMDGEVQDDSEENKEEEDPGDSGYQMGSKNFEQILAQQKTEPLSEESPTRLPYQQASQIIIDDIPATPFETSQVQIVVPPTQTHYSVESTPEREVVNTQIDNGGGGGGGGVEFQTKQKPNIEELIEEDKDMKDAMESIQVSHEELLLAAQQQNDRILEEFIQILITNSQILMGLIGPNGQRARKALFRKKRNDLVLRQMKFLQEQFSIYEEKVAFAFISEKHKQIKRTLVNFKNSLLKMIPTRISYPEWPRSINSIKDQPLKIDILLVPPENAALKKKERDLMERANQTMPRYQCEISSLKQRLISSIFKPQLTIKSSKFMKEIDGSQWRKYVEADTKENEKFRIIDERAHRLQRLVQASLIEAKGDQVFRAAISLTKKSRSISNRRLKQKFIEEMFGESTESRRYQIANVEDLFPKRLDNNDRSFFQKSNGPLDKSGESFKRVMILNRYDDNSSASADEQDEAPKKSHLAAPVQRMKDNKKGNDTTKRWSDNFQARGTQNNKPRATMHSRKPPISDRIQEIRMQQQQQLVDIDQQNESQTNLFERILSKEQIEQIELIIEQNLKFREQALYLLSGQKEIKDGSGANIKTNDKSKSRVEMALARGASFKNFSMLLAVKAQSLPGTDYYQALTKAELEKMLRDDIDDRKLKNLPKIFIVPRDIDYSAINDEVLRRLVIQMQSSPQKSGNIQNSVQKSSDYKPPTFNSQRKRSSVARAYQISTTPVQHPLQILGAAVPAFVVTDQALQELERIEKKYFDIKKVYDVLNDEAIFDSKLYTEPEEAKHKRGVDHYTAQKNRQNISDLPHPLIITIRKPQTQYEVDQNSFIIMDFLRDNYLTDFQKYSRHLTSAPRPSSRYYNTHHTRELAMLATGGFSREHHALPKWRVQNNNELLNFQVSQLRRAYSLWLSRQSMNDDIRKTLFMSRNDLLMMKVRNAPSEYLCSPALVSRTIDQIIELCLRPEDIYKLALIYKQGKKAPERFEDQSSLDTHTHGENDSMVYVEQRKFPASGEDSEVISALYLHNHPIFIPYNNDLEREETKINSFKPQSFRMSTLFGYKSKMIREGLYEVFEPAPDARYILSKVFKRAFMRVQSQKQLIHHKSSYSQSFIGGGQNYHMLAPTGGAYSSSRKK